MFVFTGFCGGLARRTEDEGNRLFSLAGCRHDEPLVAFQHLEPVLNICGIVVETCRRFKASEIDKGRGSDFGNQFFLGVCLRTEECGFVQSVQPLGMACGVNEFVEGCAVVFRGFLELRQKGKCDGIVRGTVEGPVALLMVELYARRFEIVAYDAFGLLVGFCALGKGLAVLRFQTFACRIQIAGRNGASGQWSIPSLQPGSGQTLW